MPHLALLRRATTRARRRRPTLPLRAVARLVVAPLAIASLALVTACDDDPVAPPAGLPVTLTAARPSATGGPATILGAGDSIVVVATLGTTGCADYGAVAGRRAGAVVVTITEALVENRLCTAMIEATTFRVVTRNAPRGTYTVRLERRSRPPRGRYGEPEELARAVVTLPHAVAVGAR